MYSTVQYSTWKIVGQYRTKVMESSTRVQYGSTVEEYRSGVQKRSIVGECRLLGNPGVEYKNKNTVEEYSIMYTDQWQYRSALKDYSLCL